MGGVRGMGRRIDLSGLLMAFASYGLRMMYGGMEWC